MNMDSDEPFRRSESWWIEKARVRALDSDWAGTEKLLLTAVAEHPHSIELVRSLAGICVQTGRNAKAESLLRDILAERHDDAASAFLLARVLLEEGRTHTLVEVMKAAFMPPPQDAAIVLEAVRLLNECDRKQEAAEIVDAAIESGLRDPRCHAYSGMLAMQLGHFDLARQRYLFAIENSPHACEWHAPNGLAHAQRYRDSTHSDFALFAACLQRTDLSPSAQSTLHFALGKAHDDIGDYRQAADHFRKGNAIAHQLTKWSSKPWRRIVEAKLSVKPYLNRLDETTEFVPVFIVGMPRTGSTLTAELLARHPRVCNRGELAGLHVLAQQPSLAGNPGREELVQTAALYKKLVLQDDSDAHWFIDKHPLNFLNIDLIMNLWPNARIIYSRRDARDMALSIWMQSFVDDALGFAYDFADIANVMNGCERLMKRAHERYPASVCPLHYEDLATNPRQAIERLASWLGLPENDLVGAPTAGSTIATSSVWQARQPVYTRSIGRWRQYSEYIPEILKFPGS